MVHLSKRLQAIADFVEDGDRIADIGTDHAFLPIALVEEGRVPFAIASDIGAGPVAIAKQNIADAGLNAKIDVRLADGLQGISENDNLDTVVIAGMGGELIVKILAAGISHLDGTENLVLSPHRDTDQVRQWLSDNEFGILDEKILEDEGHVYEVMLVGHTVPDVPYNAADLAFGPVLRKKRSPLFLSNLQRREDALRRVLNGLQDAADSDEIELKRADVEAELDLVEGELND